MGIFDWLRGNSDRAAAPGTTGEPPASPAPLHAVPVEHRRFSLRREDFFDLSRTATLHASLAAPAASRDASWHDTFFDAVWHGSTEVPTPTPFTGPDGFAYLRFDLPNPGAFESQSLGNLAVGLVERGVGAAIFASPNDPPDAAQYVFSMGRLDSILRFDSADGDPADVAEMDATADAAIFDVERTGARQRLTVRKAHQAYVGSPSADYLPPDAARALYRHLVQGWGIADPRVALMLDPAMQPSRSLVIGRRADGFAEGQNVDEATRMLLWYFPPRRMLMLQPDAMALDEMTPLSRYLGNLAPAND